MITVKLHAYGFDMQFYLSDRYQRVKINNSYSLWSLLKYGQPQGSILGPILFNIFLCNLFLLLDLVDIASYADDNTPYTIRKNEYEIKSKLEIMSPKLFQWFHENGMKANRDKSHFLSRVDTTKLSFPDCSIENSSSEKLQG